MTSGPTRPARAESSGTEAYGERETADYLLKHPDFLVRHPEVLAKLHVPHGAGGAVSLVERQVAVLREQLGHERGRLNHLVARAHEYEQLSARLHDLTLQLIAAPDLQRARHALEVALREQFNAEAVALKLFPVETDNPETDALVSAFIDFIDRDHCICGPLHPDQGEPLFGEHAVEIRSAALVPIKGPSQTGVLAIGSTDPHHFAPDMGTELLERLGAIASAKLTDLAHREG